MTRIAGCLVAFTLLAGPSTALAQESSPALSDRPRVEVGAGGGVLTVPGECAGARFMIDSRVGVRLSRNWSVEGLVHFRPEMDRGNVAGFYRAQALWRAGTGSLRPMVGVGAAGWFDRERWSEFRWTDPNGRLHVYPGGSDFDMSPPIFPTASVGFEKILARHLAVRAELTAVASLDEEVVFALLPSVSVTIPIGRYRTRR